MKVTIASCAGCPFFKRSLISIIASKGSEFAGDCAAPAETRPRSAPSEVTLAKTLPVTDNRIIPTWCPMRIGDIVITIGNRGST